MNFAHAWVLLLLPLYFLAEALLHYRLRSPAASLPTVAFVTPYQTWRLTVVRVLRLMPVLSAVLLIIALAGPQKIELTRHLLPSGIDIMVALDVSGSMAGEDFQPLNRLAVAKEVLRNFILGRPSDRIGLILFSGASITRSPLTLHHEPLVKTLDTVELGSLPEGTAIGSAIMSGINRLSPESRNVNVARTKGDRILLLITDGRNNAGEIHPIDALAIAARNKVKIYAIGVGSRGTVPFPVFTPEGKKTYRYEKADLDESLLKRIAEKTGGRYLRAADPKSLQNLFEQINMLEKSEPLVEESRSVQNRSPRFMVPSLALVVCYILLMITIVRLP